MKPVPLLWWSLTWAGLATSIGCRPAEPTPSATADHRQDFYSLETRPVLNIGFLSVARIGVTYDSVKPLADHLTAHTPYRFRIIIPQTSEDLVGFLEERFTEIAFLGVLDYIDAHEQYGAIPLVKPLNRDGEPVSRSVFITRNDSPIHSISDLEGRSLALSSFHSTWGNLIPRYSLRKAGIRIEDLKSLDSLAEDEEVVQSVLNRRFEAGAVKDLVAHQRKDDGLRLLHTSDPIPAGPLAIRPDLPAPVTQAILGALMALGPQDAESREGWNEELRYGFVRANDADYDPVRKMLSRSPTGCEADCHRQVEF